MSKIHPGRQENYKSRLCCCGISCTSVSQSVAVVCAFARLVSSSSPVQSSIVPDLSQVDRATNEGEGEEELRARV